MKVTYINEVERKLALSRNSRCPCGCMHYLIINQIQPRVFRDWYVLCPRCGRESLESPTRRIALKRWKGQDSD